MLVLFRLPHSGCPVLAVLFWLSYVFLLSGSNRPVRLSFSACPVRPVLSAYPTLSVLFGLSCLPILLCLSCFACLVCLSCFDCPVLPVLFCLFILFCLSCSTRHVPGFHVLAVLSWLSCQGSLVRPIQFLLSCSACSVLPVLF